MTTTPTPEAVERLAQQGHAVLGPHDDMPECVQRNLMVYVNMWQFRETLGAMTYLLARVDALTSETEGYRNWGDDVKRLTRQLDVEMHGEEMAAKQASLCDLIGAGKALRERVDALTKERDEARDTAARLAEHMSKQFYPENHPNWCVEDSTIGIILQIDNMVTGLVREDTALARLGAVQSETLDKAAMCADVHYMADHAAISIRAIPLETDAAAALERALQAERAAAVGEFLRQVHNLDSYATSREVKLACAAMKGACEDIADSILARGQKDNANAAS